MLSPPKRLNTLTLSPPNARLAKPAFALAAICLATAIFAVDSTVVQIASATIQKDLHFRSADLSWVFSAYALTYGGLLLLGGRLGDTLGHRRLFIIGMTAFGGASLCASLAQSPLELILARAAQGSAGAMAAPAALALISSIYPDGGSRNRAYGLWGIASSAGGLIGYLVGGVIVGAFGWRLIFLINVPIAAATVTSTFLVVPSSTRAGRRPSFDFAGAISVTLGLALLVYSLTEASQRGWLSAQTDLAFATAAALLVVFAVVERRTASPLLPARLYRRATVSACAVGLVMSMVLASTLFLGSLYVQQDWGYSPAHAGASTIPLSFGFAIGSRVSPRLLTSTAPRGVAALGLAIVFVSAGWMTASLPVHSYVVTFLPGWSAFGLGAAIAIVPLLNLATGGVDERDRATAAGGFTMAQQVGSVLGLALLSVIAMKASTGAVAGEAVTESGIRAAVAFGTGLCLLACLGSLLLPRSAAAPEPATPPSRTSARRTDHHGQAPRHGPGLVDGQAQPGRQRHR